MENNLTTDNLSPITPSESSPKSKSWLIILLVILCLTSLAAAGYFFYQNQQLKKLAIVTPPTPVLQPSTTPISDAPESGTSTADWQTIDDQKTNFSFQIPSNFAVSSIKQSNPDPESVWEIKQENNIIGYIIFHKKDHLYKIDSSPARIITLEEFINWNLYANCSDFKTNAFSGKLCGDNPYKNNISTIIGNVSGRFIEVSGDSINQPVLSQILSTFKFADNASATPTSP